MAISENTKAIVAKVRGQKALQLDAIREDIKQHKAAIEKLEEAEDDLILELTSLDSDIPAPVALDVEPVER